MSNTLTGMIPIIFEAFDIVARELVGFIPAVYKNSSAEQAAVGQSVTYDVVPQRSLIDITPGQLPTDDGDETVGTDSLTISKSKMYPIRWSGEEQKSVKGTYRNILLHQFAQAFRTICNAVEVDLAVTAKTSASRAYGTAGTTPFGTAGDLTDFSLVRKILDDNGVPQSDLHIVVNSASMANLRGKQSVLFKVNEAGSDANLRRGAVGDVQGFDIHNSAGLTLHTKGTSNGAHQTNGAAALGATTIALDTGAGTIVAGDVISLANGTPADANKYVVNTALTGGNVVIGKPGLLSSHVDNDVVTLANNYTPNMAFHRMAMHLVTRSPAMPEGGDMADDVELVTDPITGLVYQVALYRLYRRVKIEVGLAWGTKGVKQEFIATLLG